MDLSLEHGDVTQILMIIIYCLLISWEELSLNDTLLIVIYLLWEIVSVSYATLLWGY